MKLHLMPLVNILLILTVLNMTKIIYSHKFIMEKVFNVNSSLSKMHKITSLHFQKEIDFKTNKTNMMPNKSRIC